jgi:hypothetical protein
MKATIAAFAYGVSIINQFSFEFIAVFLTLRYVFVSRLRPFLS